MTAKAAVWGVLVVLATTAGASAQTPRLVPYSGVVRDAAGTPRAVS